jgi:hypothetical protein
MITPNAFATAGDQRLALAPGSPRLAVALVDVAVSINGRRALLPGGYTVTSPPPTAPTPTIFIS